ncbi:hypothetical protein, partial [Ilyobacter sp.]|uniref:hypothetical protein n=1 Tax=Ilyobacter sp. TaxID=3100343 RepID=UPI003561E103
MSKKIIIVMFFIFAAVLQADEKTYYEDVKIKQLEKEMENIQIKINRLKKSKEMKMSKENDGKRA